MQCNWVHPVPAEDSGQAAAGLGDSRLGEAQTAVAALQLSVGARSSLVSKSSGQPDQQAVFLRLAQGVLPAICSHYLKSSLLHLHKY